MDPDFDDMYAQPPLPLPPTPLGLNFPPPPLPQMMFGGGGPRYEPHTGDPAQDLAFEQLQNQHHQQHPQHRHEGHPTAGIPEEVCEFLRRFKRAILGKDVTEIHTLYEYVFPDLSERYYRDRFWPDAERVKHVLGPDQDIVLILYRELYYRYLYGKIQRGPALEHRFYSYQNYQDLFAHILDCDVPRDLVLPNQWLWDMVDEFIYQFQSFCQYKANPNKRTPEELEELRKMEHDVWNLYPVLNILYTLVQKSQINEQLRAMSVGESPDDVADHFGQHQTYFKLGYFSLIGLLRLHCLLGDYQQALQTVKYLEFDPKGLYNTVRNCLVTMHYFVGFARMMQRRYMQAIQIFVDCLMYIQRTRNMMQQQQKAGYQYDVISKTNDQLYHMLAICLTLQPMRIDESIQQQLQEKCGDRMNRMARGELAEFENTFQVGCPKFLLPQMNFEGMGNMSREPTNQQTKVFMDEIRQQITIPIIRGYLKLYSTMSVEKLASFMECSESQLVSHLLAYKHKMHVASVPLAALANDQTSEDSTTDLDFYVDKGMIHIADTKVARRYGEYFIRNIQKLQELDKNLHLIGTEVAKR